METFNSYQELLTANTVPEILPYMVTGNMSPPSGFLYAAELEGRYRFVEMPSDGISYRVAAIDVNDPKNMPAYIFDKFINKQDAVQKLNEARNTPGCKWTGVDPSRMIHVEDYKKERFMKTSIKSDCMDQRSPACGYVTEHLENGDVLGAMIQEAQSKLLPCSHCGYTKPRIIHYYQPADQPLPANPHKLFVLCLKGYGEEPVGHCGCQSKYWYAEDNEEDFRAALDLIVEGWNRRPT